MAGHQRKTVPGLVDIAVSSEDQVISTVEHPPEELQRQGLSQQKVFISRPAAILAVRNPSVAPSLSPGELLCTKIVFCVFLL